jgi:DNA-binding NarL/FixJ family response regulator
MWNMLIVEDNAAYRQVLRQLLAARFPAMQIAEAGDGDEALQLALTRFFDAIFMDIHLPHANGLELTKAIKAVCPRSRVCVISNHSLLEYRDAAFRSGADYFMVKGESSEVEILGLVDSWLRPPRP